MRRLLVITIGLLALAAPMVAVAKTVGPNDGTLVVRNADNGDGISQTARPVVTVVITGFVIGRVSGQGRVEIYDLDPTDTSSPEVTGAGAGQSVKGTFGDSGLIEGTSWTGTGFRFRAVSGTFRVMVYGSGVYLFAVGQGRVWFTGQSQQSGSPLGDGQYSLNGGPFVSLPFAGTKVISAGTSG